MYGYYDAFLFGGLTPIKSGKAKKAWGGINIFYHLLDLYLNRFTFDLPESMDAKFMQMTLANAGECIVADKDGAPVIYGVGTVGPLNGYGYPEYVQGIDYNGRNHGRYIPDYPGNEDIADCVSVRPLYDSLPPIARISFYADRLARINSAINSAIYNLRGSMYIQCSPEQKRAIKKMYDEVDDGSPLIFSFGASDGGLQDPPQIMYSEANANAIQTLYETYDKTLSMFCTDFGIKSNGVVNKMSGVTDEELDSTSQGTDIILMRDYKMYQKALDNVNKKWYTNCKVSIADFIEKDGARYENDKTEEVDANENNKAEEVDKDPDKKEG